jgi:phosphoglycolate phosphatase
MGIPFRGQRACKRKTQKTILVNHQTILLDLDGTLTDPTEGITNCLAHALREMGAHVPTREVLATTIGPPLRDAFRHFLQTDNAADIERAVALYRDRFAPIGLFENTVYEGIDTALAALYARGAQLILATSKPHVYAKKILEHFSLGKYFHAIHGSELDGTRDKKNELIAHILKTHNIAPDNALMIGDRAVDITGARANGVSGVGVLWGFGSREELAGAAPRLLIAATPELTAL